MSIWAIFWRFVMISILSFGGGAGIPLIERVAVRETGWIGEREFTTGIAVGQLTPGPVMVVAAFIGYRAEGLAGSLAATLGVFLVPWACAAVTARKLERARRSQWLSGFRRGASAAAVGLFGVTALGIARQALAGWPQVAIAAVALVLAARTRIHPVGILAGGALLGLMFGALSGSPPH